MFKQANPSNSCAIIVTYEPEVPVLMALLEQISEQADFLLIDNASTNAVEFLEAAQALPRCGGTRRLTQNLGLAAALNIGLREAIDAGYGFAVLFDQDSQVPVSFFANLQTSYWDAVRLCDNKVAAIGPRIVSPRNQKAMPFKLFTRLIKRSDRVIPGSIGLYCSEFLISSGCMINLAHLSAIGLMREEYFIDNIDLEWCFRARAKGFRVVGTDHAVLHHSIGLEDDNVLVRAGLMVSHSPQRSYYSTRNRFALYREPYAPWGWKLRDFPRFLLKTLWLLGFSKRRAEYWQNIRRGIVDSRRSVR